MLHWPGLVSSKGKNMTAQLPDLLEYEGTRYSLCSLPMDTCPIVRINRYELHCHSALERGYVAEWAMDGGLLYLVAINGAFDEPNRSPISIETYFQNYFPDMPSPIFANWYSGTLRCPMGKRLRYVHRGFDSVHEQDLLLEIDHGRLVSATYRNNTPPPEKVEQDSIPEFLRQRDG